MNYYKLAQFTKESTSLGMYAESIAKYVAQEFIQILKHTIATESEIETDGGLNISLLHVIKDRMKTDDATKSKLILFFSEIRQVRILLSKYSPSDILRIKRMEEKDATISERAALTSNGAGIGDGLIFVRLQTTKNTISELMPYLNRIRSIIAQDLRHELQHYMQFATHRLGEMEDKHSEHAQHMRETMEGGPKSSKFKSRYGEYHTTDKSAYLYFAQLIEVDAFASQLFMKAKVQRKAFKEVLWEFCGEEIFPAIAQELYRYNQPEEQIEENARSATIEIYDKMLENARKKYGPKVDQLLPNK